MTISRFGSVLKVIHPMPVYRCVPPCVARRLFPCGQRLADGGIGITGDERAVTFLRLDRAFLDADDAARQGEARQALDLLSFEHVVIDGRLLVFRADGLFPRRVPDDEIGIAADEDRALFG